MYIDAKHCCFALAILFSAILVPIEGSLPKLSKEEFLEILDHTDSLVLNMDVSYTIDEVFSPRIRRHPMLMIGSERHLDVIWLKEGDKYFYDIRTNNPVAPVPVSRSIDAYNGEWRFQWYPRQNTGDIFADRVRFAWPIPLDFGLVGGNRDKSLAQELREAEIVEFHQDRWSQHECYFVDANKSNGGRIQAWIDPNIGYRPRHLKIYNRSRLISSECSAEFEEVSAGIWFPMSGVYQLYGTDKETKERIVSNERKMKVRKVKLNTNLTLQDFTIEFPLGTRVYDHMRRRPYVVGAP